MNNEMSAYNFISEKIRNLEITPAQLALDPCSGSVIITDPETGQTIIAGMFNVSRQAAEIRLEQLDLLQVA